MSAWRPMQTAPKDGTKIIGLYPLFHHGNNTMTPSEYLPLLIFWKGVGWDTGAWMLHEEPAGWAPIPSLPDPPAGGDTG